MFTPEAIVIATHNQGKLGEFQEALSDLPVEFYTQGYFDINAIEEPCDTFIENALLKARHVCRATGLPAIADDSGLQVDALNGAPGVKSARYSEEHGNDQANIAKLLNELEGVPEASRTARFHCVTVYLRHASDPGPVLCEGIWEGRILKQPRGEYGFGYDPVFYVPEAHCAAGEMSMSFKNGISHRGQALACIVSKLKQELGTANE